MPPGPRRKQPQQKGPENQAPFAVSVVGYATAVVGVRTSSVVALSASNPKRPSAGLVEHCVLAGTFVEHLIHGFGWSDSVGLLDKRNVRYTAVKSLRELVQQ